MVRRVVGKALPARHRRLDGARQGGRPVREAPQQTQRRQGQDHGAGPLVPVVELEPLRRERQPGHVNAHAKQANQCQAQHPVQKHGGARIAAGRGVCSGAGGCG